MLKLARAPVQHLLSDPKPLCTTICLSVYLLTDLIILCLWALPPMSLLWTMMQQIALVYEQLLYAWGIVTHMNWLLFKMQDESPHELRLAAC